MDKLSFPEAQTPQIQVESWSNSARILQVRGFTRDGTLSHDHTTSSDRSRVSTIFDVSDIPAMLQVSPTTGPVRRGECYVRVTLLMAGFAVGRLIAGYVTDGATLAWPGGKFENFTDGAGLIRAITGTDPAAGAQILETVPTNARWRIISVRATLTTDATVANRYAGWTIDDGTNAKYKRTFHLTHLASIVDDYQAAAGVDFMAVTGGASTLPLPEMMTLFQGWRILSWVSSMVAGDNWGAPQLTIEEWIEE